MVDDEFMTLDTLPRDHYDGRISFCFFLLTTIRRMAYDRIDTMEQPRRRGFLLEFCG